MANGGWYGTPEEWHRLEAPLLGVDAAVAKFAAVHSLTVSKNHKDWPERSLAWGHSPACLIQLYLTDAEALTWNLWLCCSQDRGSKRYWRTSFAIEGQPIESFADDLPQLLLNSFEKLNVWRETPDKLEFAVDLEPLPRL